MNTIQRLFIPGNEWVYFKIYTGVKTADWIIINKMIPVIKQLEKDMLIKKFFFIRYNDPNFHIRFRFLLRDNSNFGNIVLAISQPLKPLVDKHLIWKVQMDTYQRELERYNPYLIEDTESLFHIDSIYIIKIIRLLHTFSDDKYRWMISLVLIDRILSDFKFTLMQKKDIMTLLSDSFKKEFGFNQFNAKQFNEKYRKNKIIIESILNKNIVDENYIKIEKLVNQRSINMSSIIHSMKEIAELNKINIGDYIGSYMHMTMNRLFRANNRQYELLIYDFMKRYYCSKIAILNTNNN
jgi:thiopeptide-type bacteriocin biosynthesis protein